MAAVRIIWLVGVCAIGQVATSRVLCAQAPAAAPAPAPAPTFSPQEQQARQAVLTSEPWLAATKKFNQWLSVQFVYTKEQVAEMKRRFAERVAGMTADQLKAFLAENEQRLDVLLSPDVAAARNWADAFYTPQGKRQLAQEYGFSDPLRMSPEELTTALARFAEDRQSQGTAQAAFQKQQQAQAAAVQSQQAAARQAAASAQRTATFSTPYSPQPVSRPQRYQAPYQGHSYSIGPWGGVWMGF